MFPPNSHITALFLNKVDEQIMLGKNCGTVPQAVNFPLISGTATVNTISLGEIARNYSLKGSQEE